MTFEKALTINETEVEIGRKGRGFEISTNYGGKWENGKPEREAGKVFDKVITYLKKSKKMMNSNPSIKAKEFIKTNGIRCDLDLIQADHDLRTSDLKIDYKGVTVKPDNSNFEPMFISNAELGIKD